jgi:ABC-type uncharacterized transport system permease subunit
VLLSHSTMSPLSKYTYILIGFVSSVITSIILNYIEIQLAANLVRDTYTLGGDSFTKASLTYYLLRIILVWLPYLVGPVIVTVLFSKRKKS